MAEQNIAIEQPPQIPQPKDSKLGIVLGIFIFILLAAAFGYGYFQLARVNMSLATHVRDLQTQLESTQQNVAAAQTSIQQITSDAQKNQELANQQAQMIADWKAVQKGDLEKWYLAEAQYLVKLANDHMQFTQEASMALVLLQRADQVLANLNDANLTDVRKSLSDAIAAIQINPQTDTTSLYLRINSLNAQLDNLPLPATPLPEKNAPQTPVNVTGLPWWKSGLERSWQALKQIIVVKNTADTLPLVLPDEKLFLNQNLHAQMENVMWAVLHRNSEVYNASLDRMLAWIKMYYAQDASQTQAMLQALEALRKTDIVPPKVDLSQTLKMFDDINAKNSAATQS